VSSGEGTTPGSGRPDELAATVPASSGAVATPAVLLHYRVLEKIGEGGMGAVFKAEDRRLGRVVAIKRVARGEHEPETARVRLLREARAASALNHPNIVIVHAIEEADDDAFLVMEYLEGETLAALIARGRVEPARVVAIGVEIADALACAHAAGLVHRDVKPANVIVTRRGTTKVLDFGVARQKADGAVALAVESAIVGTAPYMSPEQLRGQPLDGRCDVFALGCVLYELATGRRAFPANDLATLVQQITTDDPSSPRALAPGVPPGLEAIILRALAKDPSRRFTAAEMADALRARTDGSADPPPPLPAPSSVAVLPFLDLSAERDQDYLCDGIAEEILTALTHVEGLRVAARSTSFQFKAKPDVDARTAGTRLGVDAVLEGSVRKAGDRLRVTVQLVDVAGGHQRWSHRFDGAVADVFAIQDEIAATTARLLRGVLSATTQNALRRPGTTPEAYEHFLRGRQFLRAHGTTSLALAQRSLERAIALDPAYAPAYATLAQVHAFLVDWHGGGQPAQDAADRASARAVELGPELAETHLARAAVFAMRRDYEAAELACLEAIRQNPQSYDAHYHYARVCFQLGRDEQAAALFRRCADLQPEDFQCLLLSEVALSRIGRKAEAQEACREGILRAERVLELDPNNLRALTLGAGSLAKLGDPARALEWVRRAVAAAADGSDVSLTYNAACVYALIGEKDAAIDLLETNIARGFGKRDWVEHDSDLDSLRDDPRFVTLLARLP
jgi:non-specific serine/threonine protein kinase